MQLDREKALNSQLNELLQQEQRAAKKTKVSLKRFKILFRVLNTQVERLVANGFLVEAVKKRSCTLMRSSRCIYLLKVYRRWRR